MEGDEPVELSLSEQVLKMIEKCIYEEERSLVEHLHSQFSNRWGKITEKCLPQEEKKKLLNKYNIPDNYLFSDTPKINPEIKGIIDPQLHKAIYERNAPIVLKTRKSQYLPVCGFKNPKTIRNKKKGKKD